MKQVFEFSILDDWMDGLLDEWELWCEMGIEDENENEDDVFIWRSGRGRR